MNYREATKMVEVLLDLAQKLKDTVDAHNRAVDRIEALEKKVASLEAALRQPVYVNMREVTRVPTIVTQSL